MEVYVVLGQLSPPHALLQFFPYSSLLKQTPILPLSQPTSCPDAREGPCSYGLIAHLKSSKMLPAPLLEIFICFLTLQFT